MTPIKIESYLLEHMYIHFYQRFWVENLKERLFETPCTYLCSDALKIQKNFKMRHFYLMLMILGQKCTLKMSRLKCDETLQFTLYIPYNLVLSEVAVILYLSSLQYPWNK